MRQKDTEIYTRIQERQRQREMETVTEKDRETHREIDTHT